MKLPQHEMYLRVVATHSFSDLEVVQLALSPAGVQAHFRSLSATATRVEQRVELAVRGRDEAQARSVLEAEQGSIGSLEITPRSAAVPGAWT